MEHQLFNASEAPGPNHIVSTHFLERFHKVMAGFWFLIAMTGVCTNFLNVRTFRRVGLDDTVNIGFFSLAISDLCLCACAFLELIPFLMYVLENEYDLYFYFPPVIAAHYIVLVRRIFNVTTITITTFLALQRCLCVVIPFHVKGIFTRSRTVSYMVVIFGFSISCHALYIWRHRVVTITELSTNVTSFVVYIPPGSEPYLFLMEAFVGIALNLTCQVIAATSVVVMGVALKKTVRFRQTAHGGDRQSSATDTDSKGKAKATTSKETQALIQVSIVSIIFIITNSPYLVYGFANIFIPEFSVGQAYNNVYHLVHNIMFTFEILNSSVNFVVYYKYNSKFRAYFHIKKEYKS